MIKQKKVTGKQMCKAISEWLEKKHKVIISPKNLWEASSTGELHHVFILYEVMKEELYGRLDSESIVDGAGEKIFQKRLNYSGKIE